MPKYEVIDNFLYIDGVQVEYRPSPNHGGEIEIKFVVIHYTGDNSLEGALSWLCASRSQVSAHVVIAKDGTIYQLLPFNIKGWHAKGHYNGLTVNSYSIGIENVGVGDEWPIEQIEANKKLITALGEVYKIEDIFGHVDIPDRTAGKVDPGEFFPWHEVVDY